jgi:hypothetical protein
LKLGYHSPAAEQEQAAGAFGSRQEQEQEQKERFSIFHLKFEICNCFYFSLLFLQPDNNGRPEMTNLKSQMENGKWKMFFLLLPTAPAPAPAPADWRLLLPPLTRLSHLFPCRRAAFLGTISLAPQVTSQSISIMRVK